MFPARSTPTPAISGAPPSAPGSGQAPKKLCVQTRVPSPSSFARTTKLPGSRVPVASGPGSSLQPPPTATITPPRCAAILGLRAMPIALTKPTFEPSRFEAAAPFAGTVASRSRAALATSLDADAARSELGSSSAPGAGACGCGGRQPATMPTKERTFATRPKRMAPPPAHTLPNRGRFEGNPSAAASAARHRELWTRVLVSGLMRCAGPQHELVE